MEGGAADAPEASPVLAVRGLVALHLGAKARDLAALGDGGRLKIHGF